MRTVPFRTVYEAIVRRMGFNPRASGEPKEDIARNILSHINDRVRLLWSGWDWPELNAIEWRAFRQIWTSSLSVQQGQDVYYLGDGITPPPATADLPSTWPGPHEGYYNCILTAPPGTLPTNLTYYNLYGGPNLSALTDRYIQYAQPQQNVIGDMMDVYKQNPRETQWNSEILTSSPSSKGIDVHYTNLNVVWIRYRLPVNQYTLDPFGVGATFYDPPSGDCWVPALTALPANPTSGGTVIPFPFFLAGYVKPAAYGDTIIETTLEATIRLQLAQVAWQEAEVYLQREVDLLAAQGQRLFYPAFPSRKRHHRYYPSIKQGSIPVETFPGFN